MSMEEEQDTSKNKKEFPIEVELKNGTLKEVLVRSDLKISALKWRIYLRTNIEPKDQRIFYEGIEMDDADYRLEIFDIQERDGFKYRIKLSEVYRGIIQTYFLDEAHFDHKWTCSFENIMETKKHYRGSYEGKPMEYTRPLGCMRYAVKVIGKYSDESWLGIKGMPSDEEWPVAYHGTQELNVLEILKKGFLLEKCVRFSYGIGIYCSPDPATALEYAQNYIYDPPDGSSFKRYKLILQCRVDPEKLKIVRGGANGQVLGRRTKEYWLVPDGSAIRAYGICAFLQRPWPGDENLKFRLAQRPVRLPSLNDKTTGAIPTPSRVNNPQLPAGHLEPAASSSATGAASSNGQASSSNFEDSIVQMDNDDSEEEVVQQDN